MSSNDTNFLSFADESGVTMRDFDVKPDATTPWADALKLSHCTHSSFVGGTIIGGNENAVDCNRLCEDVLLENLSLHGGNQAAVVVKGGCRNIRFKDVLIFPAASAWCDVLWDDWSDQSRDASSGVLENVHRNDGQPVRLVFGRFKRPSIVGGNVRILWIQSIALHGYNIGKGVLRSLHLL